MPYSQYSFTSCFENTDSEVNFFVVIKKQWWPKKFNFQVVSPSSDSRTNVLEDLYKLYLWICFHTFFCPIMHCNTCTKIIIASCFKLKNTQEKYLKTVAIWIPFLTFSWFLVICILLQMLLYVLIGYMYYLGCNNLHNNFYHVVCWFNE